MQQPNPLIVILSPRDVPEVISNINNITKYDKLWIKYIKPIGEACKKMNEYFINNKEYTHIVVHQDDILITPQQIYRLIDKSAKHNIPFLTGYSNSDVDYEKHIYTFTFKPVHILRYKRVYDLINQKQLDVLKKYGEFVRVKWTGLTTAVIQRNIFEKIGGIEDDSIYNCLPITDGCCTDVVTCYKCLDKNIPIYIDLNTEAYHLKSTKSNAVTKYFYAGIKKPYIKLVPKNI